MGVLLFTLFIVSLGCAFLAALSVPEKQAGFAGVLGFLLGPFGVLAAILISIRKAIEDEWPDAQDESAPADASPATPAPPATPESLAGDE